MPILLTASLILSFGMLFPAKADAGIFSEARALFQGKVEASAPADEKPVQTMPVLKAAMNHDPNPAKGGGEVVIEDGTAVRSQGGFSGEAVIPQKDAISIYVVDEGDTLSVDAEMFDVSVNTIIWANNLPKSGTIKPGMVLTILPVSGVKYTVKSGDTLASISKKYKADEGEIAQFNGVSGALAVGTEIIIPNGQEAVAAAPASSGAAKSSGQVSPASAGYYANPLPGGRRTQPSVHGTNGVDLAIRSVASPPIVAAASGDVIIALEGGWNGGYGSYVVIRHDNGTQTLYAHMSSVSVGKGQYVSQGETIGYVGSTGKSTGPHLHFEIRGPGAPRNPF